MARVLRQAGDRAAAATGAHRLAVVNGLRGVAIAAVFFCHLINGRLAPTGSAVVLFGRPLPLSFLATNGWTGVNLFFILSGFVLYLPYAAGARSMDRLEDRLTFYRRRFLRLMPLFYIAAISEWLLAALRAPTPGFGELASVLSLGFIFDPRTFGPSFNIALWSIGDEIAFSALFPFLVLALRRLGAGRLVLAALAVALSARIGGILRFPALHGATFNSDAFVCRIDEFVLGMALARLYADGRLPQRSGLYAIIGAGLVLGAWIGFDLVLARVLPPIARAGLNDVLDAGLCAILVAALVPARRLAKALCWAPLQVSGMMCYSLYIWHLPLLDWLAPNRAQMPATAFFLMIPGFLAITFAVSALSYRFIEFRRVGDWRSLFLLGPPAVQRA